MSTVPSMEQLRKIFKALLNTYEPNRTELAEAMKMDPTHFSRSRFSQLKLTGERLIGARKYFLDRFQYDIRKDFPHLPQEFPAGMVVNEPEEVYNIDYRVRYEEALEREVASIVRQLPVFQQINDNLIQQNKILKQLSNKLSK